MEGVGEQFGKSVDAVLRRPRAAIVPFLVDIALLLLGTAIFVSLAARTLLFPQGYRLPNLPVAVPHALPTVGDIMGPTPSLHQFELPVVAAASLLILASIPLLAYAEAGFLGVLKTVYLTPHDPLLEGRHGDAWSRIREAFRDSGRRYFKSFVVLRCIQAALALVALVLPTLLPSFASYGLGVFAVDMLLLYAPYAVIETRRGAFAAIRESVQLVSDHLATTLVALLFGFLLTGGLAILLVPVLAAIGPWAPFVASAIYAPIGTALALFLYNVYLGFRPTEILPEATPAPSAAPAAG